MLYTVLAFDHVQGHSANGGDNLLRKDSQEVVDFVLKYGEWTELD